MSGITMSNYTNSTKISVGAQDNGGTTRFFLAGDMDELGIWSRALSQADITALQTTYY